MAALRRRGPSRRRVLALAPLAAALAVAAPTAPAAAPIEQTPDTSVAGTWTPASPASAVATVRAREISVYARPGGPLRTRLRNPNAAAAPLTFLVRQWRPGWYRVYLPIRPNGSTGWVRASDVTLARDDFRVFVDLRAHRLTVFRGGAAIERAPIGVGRAATPTPSGVYYVTALLRQSDPFGLYGPYAFGLSAFSDALFHFGGGPGEIGLHGTDFAAGLGHDVSHGCIRVGNAVIVRLARLLPLGTPVVIER